MRYNFSSFFPIEVAVDPFFEAFGAEDEDEDDNSSTDGGVVVMATREGVDGSVGNGPDLVCLGDLSDFLAIHCCLRFILFG